VRSFGRARARRWLAPPASFGGVTRAHGVTFDGSQVWLATGETLQGRVVAKIPAPGKGNDSGLTWAVGTLWVGQYRDRKIHQIEPATGKILRTIESNRFVTGVTWVDGEL
jgi:hypothetical protein